MKSRHLPLLVLVLALFAMFPPWATADSAGDDDDSAAEALYPGPSGDPVDLYVEGGPTAVLDPTIVDDDDSSVPPLPDPSDEEIQEALGVLFSGAAAGASAIVLAVVTLLGAVLRHFRLLDYMPRKARIVVACSLALAGSVGAALGTGVVWWAALVYGLFGGITQLGLWLRLIDALPKPD